MSDLPKDDAPDALGAPVDETARTQPWTPATDAGRAGETEQPQKPPARARRPAKAEPHDGGGARQPVPDDADADDVLPDDALPAGSAMPDAEVAGSTPPGERIAKVIARAGIASRRDVEAMILAGRVSVNGTTLTSPALNVTDEDRITVDGEPLPARERSRLWIFHKPRGLVTTARDPEGRQTVFEVLPEDVPRVVAIGRLDINTEGLLLLTNDGGLAKVIAHPDTGWLRRYRVRAHGDTDQAQLDQLAKGVTIDGMEYGPVEATLDRVQGDNLWLTLGLREGKNREVKRILEHLGLSVNRLIRLSFGPFQLGDLEVGLVEEIKTRVLKDQLGKSLAEQAGVDFESPVREPIAPFGDGGRKAKGPAETARPARSARDAARPAPVPRVATGGTGSGPRRSAWRADEDTPNHRPGRAPRRGSDPRAAQAAAAERGRERVGSIKAGERRVVVERLAASAPPPVVEEAPRRRYADRGAPNRPPQTEGGRRDGERGGGRPSHGGETGRRDERSAPRDGGRPKRAYEGAGDARQGERRERPSSDRTDGAPRGGGGFRERQGAGGGRPDAGGRGFSGGKPGPGKGSFGKGASGQGAPGKGGPGKGSFGKGAFGKGPSDGARPGPRGGGKPGFSGAKPGGRGGAGGGFRGSGKPGGGGGGRPSRGGR